MRSKMYYSNNKQLLEGIIARKLTKKKLQEAREAKEYDIFNEQKVHRLATTESQNLRNELKKGKIHNLTQSYLQNFNSLKSTFSAVPPPSFYDSISKHIEENLKFYTKEYNQELTDEEKKYGHARLRRFREIFKSSIDFEKFVKEYESKENEIKDYKNKIKDTEREEMNLLIKRGKMQEEVNRLEGVTKQSRKSVAPVMGRNLKNVKGRRVSKMAFSRISRGRNFDVVEYAANRGLFGSNLINPLFVIKAQLANLDKPMNNAKKVLEHYKEKLNIIKNQKN